MLVNANPKGPEQTSVTLAWPIIVLFLRKLIAAILVNGLLILVSPVVWHRTPWWFRSVSGIPGNADPNRGSIRIRINGAGLLLLTTVLLYGVLCQPHGSQRYRLYRVTPPPSKSN